jgi:hypothetical protein
MKDIKANGVERKSKMKGAKFRQGEERKELTIAHRSSSTDPQTMQIYAPRARSKSLMK